MPVLSRVKTVRGGFLPAAVVILAVAAALSGPAAYATDATWKGSPAEGDWNTAANWEGGVVPNGASYDVYIDGAKTGTASQVRLDITTTIGNLAIDAGDRLTINNGMDLTITGTQIVNAGTIATDSTSHSYLDLKIDAPTCTLSGGGVVTLGQTTYCTVRGITGDEVLVNVDNTIQGAGQVGYNTMALTNQAAGLVVANLAGGVLEIDPNTTAAVNRGTFRATGNGTLLLTAGTFDNAGGTIEALDGSIVELYNAVIQGGLLTTAGSGVIRATLSGTAAAVLDGTVSAVTNAGAFEVKHACSATLKGDIINSGVLTVKPTGAATTELYVGGGDVTLNGGGTVTLDMDVYAIVRGVAGTDRLINVNNTIQGTGRLGYNTMALTNQAGGLIVADRAASTLEIDPSASGVVNRGTFRATGGGTLLLAQGTFDNAGGTIEALDGSNVELYNAVIQGGLLTTAGSGVIQATLSGTAAAVLDGTASAVTNAGAFEVKHACSATLKGTIINSGVLTVKPTGAATTELYVGGGDVTLSGGGTVALDMDVYALVRGVAATDRLINVDNTIRGTGEVGYNFMGLTNQAAGLIVADRAGETLEIDPSASGAVNRGTLRATGNGTLLLTDGTFDNAGGTIEALDGSIVELYNAVIQGGLLTTAGSGVIRATIAGTAAAVLDGTAEAVTNTGAFEVKNACAATLKGTITNLGVLTVKPTTASMTELYVGGGDVTLNGGGSVVLDKSINAVLCGVAATDRLINVDNTIRGTGQVGYNTMGLTNQAAGLVVADRAGETLEIDPSASGAVNRGTFRATGNGTLLLAQGTFDNAGGTIEALDGSIVELYNAVIQGGLLTTAGSGVIRATIAGTAAAVLDGTASAVTNAGAFEVKNACAATLKGDIINSGVLTVKPTGAATTELYVGGGDVTLSGGGTVALVNQTYATIVGVAATDRLINQDNLIQGKGQVGKNLMRLLNRGTIDANADAALTLDPSTAADGVVNEGLLRASAAGGLTCTSGTFTNSGTIEAAGGDVTFTASAAIANYNAATDTLTGGTWKAMAGSAIIFNGTPPIATNAADVTLSGGGSVFLPINSLATNAAAGAFHVLGGRAFTTAGTLGNAGEVEVGPGSTVTVSGNYVQTSGRTIVDGILATSGGGVVDILGGDLLGGGTITAEVRLAGTVRPGTSVDTLSAERLLIQSGAAYEFEIDGPVADLVDVLGTGDAFQIDPDPAVPYVVNVTVLNAAGLLSEYVLFHWAGDDPLTQGDFDRLPHVVSLPPGASGHWEYRPDDNQIVLTNFIVPEPATLGLLGLGLVAALARRRRARA